MISDGECVTLPLTGVAGEWSLHQWDQRIVMLLPRGIEWLVVGIET